MSDSAEALGRPGFVFHNWARTYSCRPELYFEPADEAELKQIITMARRKSKKVKVIGKGHSPSDIACTNDYMISMKHFNKVISYDLESRKVTVEGGMVLTDLNHALAEHGLAMSVLGSVSDITIGGAVSTATHGTGINYGTLCSYVVAVDLLTAGGDVIHASRDHEPDTFRATLCGLGAVGIILRVTLQCEPAFNLHQSQYPTSLEAVLTSLDVHVRASDHTRFMWFPHTDDVVVVHNTRTDKPVTNNASWFWDYAIGYFLLEFLFWLSTFWSPLVPWINRLYYKRLHGVRKQRVGASHEVFNFECLFQQYVMEWAIPRSKTALVLLELKAWIENTRFPAHFPVEVRFVKSEDIFLSPAYGRDSCYINLVMYRPYDKLVKHQTYWNAFEGIMLAAGGRPHWAKDHRLSSEELALLYPDWEKFQSLRRKLDPTGLFMNDRLAKLLT